MYRREHLREFQQLKEVKRRAPQTVITDLEVSLHEFYVPRLGRTRQMPALPSAQQVSNEADAFVRSLPVHKLQAATRRE